MSLDPEGTGLTRRTAIRAIGGFGMAVAAASAGLLSALPAWAQTGKPEPEEPVGATLQRLFGSRPLTDGSSVIKFDMPLIAENGASVPITVDASVPMTPQQYAKTIYIIADKNRRPLSARFFFTPDSGQALVGTNLRLGGTTDVRAVVEMNDGRLLMVTRNVKVTVGGCGG